MRLLDRLAQRQRTVHGTDTLIEQVAESVGRAEQYVVETVERSARTIEEIGNNPIVDVIFPPIPEHHSRHRRLRSYQRRWEIEG